MLVAFLISASAIPAFAEDTDNGSAYNTYVNTTASILQQCNILKDAGKCDGPFGIGKRVAAEMDNSIAGMIQERADIADAVKKGKAGKPVVDKYQKTAQDDKDQMSQNLNMVLYGLSGNSPACVTATNAFKELYSLSSQLPDLLTEISGSLK